ncbi:MAG: radical protein [Actinomycetia bacterium]|nr:radical protein [Actinomycetes bacterium]
MRWRTEGDDGQEQLFDDLDRHVGRGEFRGMTFLHVRARRVVNTLPETSPFAFRHTINAYRGCSHACSYCLDGDTPVLLADGRTRALRRLKVGDVVTGTDDGKPVPTTVLDHWATERPAYRVTLGDGTVLTASADHRFLTERGWRAVRELGPADVLVTLDGTDPSTAAFRAENGVVRVQPLGEERRLYDITTGTGDFVADGVVSHNCFARPTHDYLGLDVDEGFERDIVVKVNAVERVRAELAPKRWKGEPIAMGTNTDPYQRCEGKYRLTRGIVEVLSAARNPFSILTKSTLMLRDVELLAEAAQRTEVSLMFSVGTLDEEVWRATEPGTPHPRLRLEAIARLRDAGIPCGVLMAPLLPGLSDDAAGIRAVVAGAREAGASHVSGGPLLYLTPPVREVFMKRLAVSHPHLVERYERLYQGTRAPKEEQDRVRAIVDAALGRRPRTARPAPFRKPVPRPAPVPEPTEQLSLGV